MSTALSIAAALALAGLVIGQGSGSAPPAPACAAAADPRPAADRTGVPIELARAGHAASAVVEDSAAGGALLARLPLTVHLRDSFGLAMVGEMSLPTVMQAAPIACGFEVGVLVYSPTDQAIAIFHSPQAELLATPELVRLGVVTHGLEAVLDGGQVTIRRVD